MADATTLINALEKCRGQSMKMGLKGAFFDTEIIDQIIALLKAQEIEEPHPWEHIWDAPDYTFKGRCRNCGFIQYFIQGHDAQYRFCPQCGEQKVI